MSAGENGPSPTRTERDREVDALVLNEAERAMSRFCEDVDALVRAGMVTEEEVSRALSGYPDYADSWDSWVAEAGS